MLRFFRSLRRKLLEDGHLNKYFWYAIGEVFLVVIGILIALQINNWNQSRIETKELNLLLLSISKNMAQDIEEVEIKVRDTQEARILATNFLNISSAEEVDLDSLGDQLSAIFVEYYININDSGFDALKSSGLIGKLRDTEFEELLFNYYIKVELVRDIETSGNEFIEEMEAEAAKTGAFINIFDLFFMKEKNEEPDKEAILTAINDVINSTAVRGAAGRVAIRTDVIVAYNELIEIANRFIDLVEELD